MRRRVQQPGNPAVEPGYAPAKGKPDGTPGLSSALALPLVNAGQVVGVVALYRRERDAFAADELVAMLDVCPALASLLLDIDQLDIDQGDAAEPSNNLLEMANAIRLNSETRVGV